MGKLLTPSGIILPPSAKLQKTLQECAEGIALASSAKMGRKIELILLAVNGSNGDNAFASSLPREKLIQVLDAILIDLPMPKQPVLVETLKFACDETKRMVSSIVGADISIIAIALDFLARDVVYMGTIPQDQGNRFVAEFVKALKRQTPKFQLGAIKPMGTA